MTSPIKLIVGLGNPGSRYSDTRHNVGSWLIETLCSQNNITLKNEAKFKGLTALYSHQGTTCHILIPTTYMNLSGQSILAMANFYKILPKEIIVAHDDLDLAPGTVKLKFNGGHGGHNGLRDIFSRLGTKEFYRLRIGIGHPGHKDDVTDYVLHKPSKADNIKILDSIDDALSVMPLIIKGEFEKAMHQLHTNV